MTAILAGLGALALSASDNPAALVGTWNVTMTVNYASCPGNSVGDTKSEQWNVNLVGGQLNVVVSGQSQTNTSYEGTRDDDGVIRLRAGPMTGVELKEVGHKLVGRRIHANPLGKGACALVYDVKGTKSN